MKSKVLAGRILTVLVGIILITVPFYAFLTVWGSSVIGHYTALRLYTEVLLVLATMVAVYIVTIDKTIRRELLRSKTIWLIIGYAALIIIVGLVAYYTKNVTAKALGYGVVVDSRFLLFFIVTWVAALASNFLRKHWVPIVLWPAAIVTLFGLLQAFILPQDFLKHFGYGQSTIPAYQTINSNQSYVRIQSTLRGVNPYGAYLVLITSVMTALILKLRRNYKMVALLIASLVTLIYTFSRSAWIGTFVALAFVVVLALYKTRLFKAVVLGGLILLIIAAALVVTDHSTRLQNIIYHTQSNSAVKTTSDQGHLSGLESGLKDIYHQSLGGGVGTAGPASTYNPKRIRIAENYYIQIGQETGVLGLGLFLAINISVACRLWRRRDSSLALGLFASFLGLVVVNMLSHAWEDPTLSYLWWGLAGIAMTIKVPTERKASKLA
jgi:O-antigen ligase